MYPITYAALLAARRILAAEQVQDVADLLAPEGRHQQYERSLRDTDALMAAVEGDPLLGGIDPGFAYYALFHTYLFAAMIEEARRRHGQGPVVVMPFYAKAVAPVTLLKVAQSLDLAASEANWFHRVGRLEKAALAAWRWVGAGVYAALAWREVRAKQKAQREAEVIDVLVVGFEGADRRNQAALFERLCGESGLTVRWCRPVGDRFQQTADEQARESAAPHMAGVQDVDWDAKIPKPIRLIAALLEHLLRARLAKKIASIQGLPFSARGAVLLANQWVDASAAAKYATVRATLDRYRPRLVVLSATHQLNRHARLWAGARGVDTLRLPHGVEYVNYMACWWAFDAVGLPGKRAMRDFNAGRPGRHTVTGVVGGMGHVSQFTSARTASSTTETAVVPERVVLFPLSFISYLFPDTPAELERDVTGLLTGLEKNGYRLRLRNHPRAGMWMPDDYRRLHAMLGHPAFALGDSQASLVAELHGCRVVLARHWSGAIVQALYHRAPIIAWLPRPGTTYSDAVLADFPMVARTVDEFVNWLQRLDEESVVTDVLRKQDILLADLFEDPYNDSPERAATFVLKVLKEKSGRG